MVSRRGIAFAERNGEVLLALEISVLGTALALLTDQPVIAAGIATFGSATTAGVALYVRERDRRADADVHELALVFVIETAREVLDRWLLVATVGQQWKPAVTMRGLAQSIAGDARGDEAGYIASRGRELGSEIRAARESFPAAAGQATDPAVKRFAMRFAADLGHAAAEAHGGWISMQVLFSKRAEKAPQVELDEYARVTRASYITLGRVLARLVAEEAQLSASRAGDGK